MPSDPKMGEEGVFGGSPQLQITVVLQKLMLDKSLNDSFLKMIPCLHIHLHEEIQTTILNRIKATLCRIWKCLTLAPFMIVSDKTDSRAHSLQLSELKQKKSNWWMCLDKCWADRINVRSCCFNKEDQRPQYTSNQLGYCVKRFWLLLQLSESQMQMAPAPGSTVGKRVSDAVRLVEKHLTAPVQVSRWPSVCECVCMNDSGHLAWQPLPSVCEWVNVRGHVKCFEWSEDKKGLHVQHENTELKCQACVLCNK